MLLTTLYDHLIKVTYLKCLRLKFTYNVECITRCETNKIDNDSYKWINVCISIHFVTSLIHKSSVGYHSISTRAYLMFIRSCQHHQQQYLHQGSAKTATVLIPILCGKILYRKHNFLILTACVTCLYSCLFIIYKCIHSFN